MTSVEESDADRMPDDGGDRASRGVVNFTIPPD